MLNIRPADFTDIDSITEIYNEAILTTTATFDLEPKSVEDRRRWLEGRSDRHPVLVATVNNVVVGWSSLSPWKERAAYNDTAETSFYVKSDHRGKGIGRKLKAAIIEEARRLGFRTLIAGCAEGSDASMHLNEAYGFQRVGTFRDVGLKFGKHLDVTYFQLALSKRIQGSELETAPSKNETGSVETSFLLAAKRNVESSTATMCHSVGQRGDDSLDQFLVYGDSLSWGIIPGTRERLPFSKRWPGVLEAELQSRGLPVRIVEDCLNGRRTVLDDAVKPGRNGLIGLEQRLEINSPLALVIIMLGVNDFQTGHDFTASESAQGLATLVAAVRRAPIEPGMPRPDVLLVAPPELRSSRGPLSSKFANAEARSAGLTNSIRDVAIETECEFFDAGSVAATSDVDGVHLDESQHYALGIALADTIARKRKQFACLRT